MVSPTVNVVRYTALVSGIGYGIFHRRTLQAREDKHAQEKAYRHKEELIAKAKEAYKNRLVASKADDGVVTNPDDPRFDLEKALQKFEAQSK